MKEISFEIDQSDSDRLDKVLAGLCSDFSRTYIQKLIKDDLVSVDGMSRKGSYQLEGGELVKVMLPDAVSLEIIAEDIPLDVLYEDGDVIVVNKPKGMVVHPAPGHMSGTLVNALMYRLGDSLSGIGGVLRPGIVHRIDRDTTGSLIVCKNDAAHRCLSEQLEEHSINRIYKAIVNGNIKDDSGVIDAPIGRSKSDRKKMGIVPDGKRAVTHYEVLERFGDYTYVACKLETGRTHQIRVHMASLGHPVLGDEVYSSGRSPFKTVGQTLHAEVLGFKRPSDGEYVEVKAPIPEYFEKILRALRNR
ncbi:MAG: RluA family pseudouridine synthase [Lachnospiraceae bacterium]|nr:RluA family pseudouridine synthase [Lachnospiraceae bacterium]